jgi:transposase
VLRHEPGVHEGVEEHLAEPDAADPDAQVDASAEVAEVLASGSEGAAGPTPGVADEAPEPHRPEIIFDRYHVVAKVNEAVDEVRRAESKRRPELKGSRYVWLKNEPNLTARQRQTLTWLTRPSMRLASARAARWRDDFSAFYDKTDPEEAEAYLKRWCYGAKRSRLDPVKSFVAMIEAHWDGVVAWQHNRRSNGLLEGTSSLVQAAKRRARGYRNKAKMITIIYLIAGKLPLPEIHTI